MNDFPVLSAIAYLPLLGALIIFFIPKASRETSRMVALLTSLGSLVLSGYLLFAFKHNAEFQFTEHKTWLKDLGVSYFLGVDGIAVLLIALTTLLSTIAVIWSWDSINTRTREYYIALLVLETGMLGVFMALDLFVFYIFWELMLIPMALLIGVWGSTNRVYAAVKFFLYTLFGSLLMLVAIIATYQDYFAATGIRTLNVLELQAGNYSSTFQFWVFAAFFLAFAVKVPMFPFHTWLPDAHVEAPTAASVLLAAVMLKMGGYGLLRFNLPLYPQAAQDWAPVIIALSVIGIIYGALVALVQPDMKKLIAYSSVSHMGFVTLGIFLFNLQGMEGSMVVMLAHGFNTGALFLLVGVIYDRAHTRLIAAFGGIATRMPVYAAMWMLFMFASIGLPGLSGFVGEFLVALAAWNYNPWVAFFTFSVVIFSAWYLIWMVQRVVFGRLPGEPPEPGDNALTSEERDALHRERNVGVSQDGPAFPGHGTLRPVTGGAHAQEMPSLPAERVDSSGWRDLTPKELITLLPLAALTIAAGIYPKPIFDIVEPSMKAILDNAMRVVGG